MNGVGTKAGRYLIAGGLAAVVDTGLFAILLAVGLPVPVAAGISFLVATVVNYAISARFVFGARRGFGGYLRFLAAASIGFVINVGLTSWLPGPLAALLPAAWVAALPPLPIIAKAIAIVIAFGFNFIVNLLVVFRAAETR